ncbi:hypothetical protein D3C81_2040410 [compost metagenome]
MGDFERVVRQALLCRGVTEAGNKNAASATSAGGVCFCGKLAQGGTHSRGTVVLWRLFILLFERAAEMSRVSEAPLVGD